MAEVSGVGLIKVQGDPLYVAGKYSVYQLYQQQLRENNDIWNYGVVGPLGAVEACTASQAVACMVAENFDKMLKEVQGTGAAPVQLKLFKPDGDSTH